MGAIGRQDCCAPQFDSVKMLLTLIAQDVTINYRVTLLSIKYK